MATRPSVRDNGNKTILTFWYRNRWHTLVECDRPMVSDTAECLGYQDHYEAVVCIKSSLVGRHRAEVLLHELLHLTQANLRGFFCTEQDKVEEHFVSLSAEGMTEMFGDNPKLLKYYLELLNDQR